MATDIIITGTGNPAPSPDRAGPGCMVRHGDTALQFDAGRGTVQRMVGAGTGPVRLSAFFATHHHSDHLVGLPDLVMTRWIMDRVDGGTALPIVVPEGPCVDFVNRMLDPWEHDLAVRQEHTGRTTGPDFDLVGFPYPSTPTEVWSAGDVRVLAGQVRHEPVHPAVGYRVETPDGAVAITGDTLVCDEVAELADGVDVLVYEAMRFSVIEAEPPYRHFILDYHADTRLIGVQAAELEVDTLILTHLIPAPTTDEDRAGYEADIRAGGFTGNLIVADDLATVTI
jgi:ribonuclease Z